MTRFYMRSAIAICVAGCVVSAGANAQSFNIDLDVNWGGPWAGAPSSAMGAAADQAGVWNRVGANFLTNPVALVDTNDTATQSVLRLITSPDKLQSGGADSTVGGDYARLMCDSLTINAATFGTATFQFENLIPGAYRLYTYAGDINAAATAAVIVSPDGDGIWRTVTGPAPVGGFEQGRSHTVHSFNVGEGSLRVQVIALTAQVEVYGFQLVRIPAPGASGGIVFALGLYLARRRR